MQKLYFCKYYNQICWHIENPNSMCMLWYRGYNEVFDYHGCGHLYEVPEIQI